MIDCGAGNLCFALAIRTKASGNSLCMWRYMGSLHKVKLGRKVLLKECG